MRRRRFIELAAATSFVNTAAAEADTEAPSPVLRLRFHSAGSFYDAHGGPLTDDAYVPVWAEETATNTDADFHFDAFEYWESRQIPLMAVDGNVVAFGSMLVDDQSIDETYDNVQFLLNVWETEIGTGTVLWDESNDQYWTLERFSEFASAAESRGFDVQASENLHNDLSSADAAVITAPGDSLSDGELDRLAEFVDAGGTLLLHNRSDYNDYDRTQQLNEICERLGTVFRFNDDQVYDTEHNAGRIYQPTTDVFTTSFPYFDSEDGGGDEDDEGSEGDDGDEDDGDDGDENAAPAATVTVDSTTVTPGGSVTFDGTASSDADGTITSYDWTFGDGTTASGSTVSHAYDRPGSYDATLTVTDDDGATATDSVTIDVSDETPETTEVTVEHLSDGDTLDVTMPDGTAESIRVLGIDTPELPGNSDAERPPEWEGIDSYEYLGRWGERASEFAKQAFEVGDTVEIYFDDVADRRDPFDRLLAYVRYDATGDGSRDTLYNRKIIEEGYARVYGSGLAKHDGFRNAEEAARTSNRGVWENADPGTVSELRDSAVEELFVPKARAVTTGASAIDSDRIPVTDADGDNALVGVDESTNVAMVGGLLIDETYESEEGFPVDTADYGNFPFLTNLLDALGTTTSGPVLIDGGHGQFGSDAALSSEDAAYYQRYLEGQGIDFQQRNDLATADLASARAIIVTTPVSSFTTDEVNALTEFLEAGGAVVLIGASNGDPTALNDLASALGTDLRLGDAVTDYSSNLDDDETVPVTARFDSTFDLFGPHS